LESPSASSGAHGKNPASEDTGLRSGIRRSERAPDMAYYGGYAVHENSYHTSDNLSSGGGGSGEPPLRDGSNTDDTVKLENQRYEIVLALSLGDEECAEDACLRMWFAGKLLSLSDEEFMPYANTVICSVRVDAGRRAASEKRRQELLRRRLLCSDGPSRTSVDPLEVLCDRERTQWLREAARRIYEVLEAIAPQVIEVFRLYAEDGYSVARACRQAGCPRKTYYEIRRCRELALIREAMPKMI